MTHFVACTNLFERAGIFDNVRFGLLLSVTIPSNMFTSICYVLLLLLLLRIIIIIIIIYHRYAGYLQLYRVYT